jgi:peptidyl-prolyl cis-trans isomerase A (cyclophilin A)
MTPSRSYDPHDTLSRRSSRRIGPVPAKKPAMVQRTRLSLGISLLALACVGGAVPTMSCSSSTPSGTSGGLPDASDPPDTGSVTPETDAGDDAGPPPDLLPGCTKDPGAPAPAFDPASATDPIGTADKFTMELALAGFPAGGGKLTAAISTEKSTIKCELLETVAPISVANFVGLARGTRPYKISGKWQVGHFYDGLTWHRVIPKFVIQGGDPLGDGTGGPGYSLIPENHVEEPLGTLAMAASDKPSGSQFYVVVGTGPAANYNVFGKCSTEAAIAIAGVPRDSSNDMPKTPVHLLKVVIGRCP